jgi:hypothetical protein
MPVSDIGPNDTLIRAAPLQDAAAKDRVDAFRIRDIEHDDGRAESLDHLRLQTAVAHRESNVLRE